ncbi:hypothetical protein [Celerinatantimonas diazotrophica]|uniref:Uncharacterized protein n=1 Tax=Celerinatantimonas diazotrophica TaxID=412034 RepID=A0A4R1JA08_9GAMM|nr:hypothetical protein [Celerinatantimonas diazotrophica]TCK47360.1 hypothetical protein EV690_2382 [Celerinatantimonas diazotrophica]CAG9295022.1 hypothetical protein CEDIAZO_00128 [Celerinatantimonas diazotrophica]
MIQLQLNAPLASLQDKQEASLPYAPAAGLLVVIQNQTLKTSATASYNLGRQTLGKIFIPKYNSDLYCQTVQGNGFTLSIQNISAASESVIGASLFGFGPASLGQIPVGSPAANITQLQSLAIITEPYKIGLEFSSKNKDRQSFYLFEPRKMPVLYELKPVSSSNPGPTDATQVLNLSGDWEGNMLLIVNTSSDADSSIRVSVNKDTDNA